MKHRSDSIFSVTDSQVMIHSESSLLRHSLCNTFSLYLSHFWGHIILSERFFTTTGSSAILLSFPLTWISSLLTVTPFGLMRTSPGKIHHFHPNPAIRTFTAGVRAFPYPAGLPSVTANSGSLSFSSGLCLGLPSDSPLPVTPLPLANASLTPHIRVFHPIVVYHAGRTGCRIRSGMTGGAVIPGSDPGPLLRKP